VSYTSAVLPLARDASHRCLLLLLDSPCTAPDDFQAKEAGPSLLSDRMTSPQMTQRFV
jgi:hypothetical protein